jgi:hypothetical protein
LCFSALELDDDQHEDHDVEELYFTQPQQMMDELARIEERNLFLIQNCQTTEEQIEELKQKMGTTRDALYVFDSKFSNRYDLL